MLVSQFQKRTTTGSLYFFHVWTFILIDMAAILLEQCRKGPSTTYFRTLTAIVGIKTYDKYGLWRTQWLCCCTSRAWFCTVGLPKHFKNCIICTVSDYCVTHEQWFRQRGGTTAECLTRVDGGRRTFVNYNSCFVPYRTSLARTLA